MMIMQKLGQKLALDFGAQLAKSVSFHCRIVQFARIQKWVKPSFCSCNKSAFPQMSGLSAIASLLFLWLTSGLHHIADVLVTLNKWMVRHWKLLLWLLVYFLEGGVCVPLWGVAFLGCFWGNEGHSIEVSCWGPSEVQSMLWSKSTLFRAL